MLSRVSRRTYATSASSFKLISKEFESPVSKLQIVVKNAGSKNNDSKTGLSHLLSNFNFLNTSSKSGLRLKRESELLGGSYRSYVTRDDLILEAQFLKEDLPYYLNSIGSTLSELSFKPHEFDEIVLPTSIHQQHAFAQDSKFQALESLHKVSFRSGLGNQLYYDGVSKISLQDLQNFAKQYYTKENIEIKSFGVVEKDLAKFLESSSFSMLTSSGTATTSATAKIYTGEQFQLRTSSTKKTTAAIGIPIKSAADESTYYALAAFVNSKFPTSLAIDIESAVKSYTDGSLFYVTVSSSSPESVTTTIKTIAKELKTVKGLSKLSPAVELQSASGSVDAKSIKDSFKLDKFNYVVVGNTDGAAFIDEL